MKFLTAQKMIDTPVSRDHFNAIIYGLIGLCKMLALTFFVFPLLTMLVLNKLALPRQNLKKL